MPRSHNIIFTFLTLQFIRRVCLTIQYSAIRCFALLVLALYCPLMVDRCYVSHALSIRRQLLIVQDLIVLLIIDHSLIACLVIVQGLTLQLSHFSSHDCWTFTSQIVTFLTHTSSITFFNASHVCVLLLHFLHLIFVTLLVMTVDFIAVLNDPVSHTSIHHASIYRVLYSRTALHFTALYNYRFLEPRFSTFQCITRQFDHTSMSPNPICVFYHL